MLEEEFPIETILAALDAMSPSSSPPPPTPKVLLFDIGGVCVISPFQAILNYELSLGIPPGWINHSISRTAPHGFWHRLETGTLPLDDTWYAGFYSDLHSPTRWKTFYTTIARRNDPSLPETVPPVPQIDAKYLFTEMMTSSRAPDPWMLPALKALRADGRFIIAALSNTVIFPPGHPLAEPNFFDGAHPIRGLFDVFVSSAHVGLRKPDPRIYQLALREVDEFARREADSERGRRGGWAGGVKAEDVLFLDDIGENLKAGKKAGFRTIKVPLGRTYEAVDQLEEATGLKLAGDHPRVPVLPKYGKAVDKAKI